MPAKWTGKLIGEMHNANVTYAELAKEVGCGKPYISMILNGQRNPKGAKEKLCSAFARVLEKRKEAENDKQN